VSDARPYFPLLDGLRAFAILPVIWHHATPGPLPGVLGRGPLGVDLFFVLSGFLITTLLLRERPIDLRAFWIRRSLRIFPLYYLVLGAYVGHALFFRAPGPVRDHFLASVPYFVTYTSNWFPRGHVDHPVAFSFAWSLATEEQFYLVWPLVLRFARRFAAPSVVLAVALDAAAERGLFGAGLLAVLLRSFATPIAGGALLALGLAHGKVGPLLRLLLRRSLGPAAALLVVAVVLPLSPGCTHVVMTVLVGAAAVTDRNRLLEWAPLRHVGRVSYGMYLFNVSAVVLVKSVVTAASPVFVLATALTVGLASLSHRWIERPLLQRRRSATTP